jgi:hypothetical protein
MEKAKTGDLILFSDLFWITSSLTRLASWSRWTHVAMVVRWPIEYPRADDDSQKDDLLILEAGHDLWCFDYLTGTTKRSGVRLVSLREKMRLFHRKNHVRLVYLTPPTTPAFDDNNNLWEQEIQKDLVPLLQTLTSLNFTSNYYTFIRAAVNRKQWQRLTPSELEHEHQIALITQRLQNKKHIFCTELIILLYQYLGILAVGDRVNPKRFNPGDFSKGRLPLKAGWSLTLALENLHL